MLEKGEEDVTEYLIEKYKPMVRQRVRVLYLMAEESRRSNPGGNDWAF